MKEGRTVTGPELGADQDLISPSRIRSPFPAALPDEAWIRAAQHPNDAGAALTAVLKAIDGPTPSRTVRFAAALMLEPHLLTLLLPGDQAREWRRLVGQEAEPRAGNVIGFAARQSRMGDRRLQPSRQRTSDREPVGGNMGARAWPQCLRHRRLAGWSRALRAGGAGRARPDCDGRLDAGRGSGLDRKCHSSMSSSRPRSSASPFRQG